MSMEPFGVPVGFNSMGDMTPFTRFNSQGDYVPFHTNSMGDTTLHASYSRNGDPIAFATGPSGDAIMTTRELLHHPAMPQRPGISFTREHITVYPVREPVSSEPTIEIPETINDQTHATDLVDDTKGSTDLKINPVLGLSEAMPEHFQQFLHSVKQREEQETRRPRSFWKILFR